MTLRLHPHSARSGGVTYRFEVLRRRKWEVVYVGGTTEQLADERAIQIYGGLPVIRRADTKAVIWRRRRKPLPAGSVIRTLPAATKAPGQGES